MSETMSELQAQMTEEGLWIEAWFGGADGSYRYGLLKVSRVRVTRVDAAGVPEVAYIAWDGLD